MRLPVLPNVPSSRASPSSAPARWARAVASVSPKCGSGKCSRLSFRRRWDYIVPKSRRDLRQSRYAKEWAIPAGSRSCTGERRIHRRKRNWKGRFRAHLHPWPISARSARWDNGGGRGQRKRPARCEATCRSRCCHDMRRAGAFHNEGGEYADYEDA